MLNFKLIFPAQSLLSPPYMVRHPSILLIEDSPGECELFRLALVQIGLDVPSIPRSRRLASPCTLRNSATSSASARWWK